MEQQKLSFTERVKNEFLAFPTEGLLLHGTSSHRAQLIRNQGFQAWNAGGSTIDKFANHFFYYNPDEKYVTSSTFSRVLRHNIGLLISYAKWSTRNDISEGRNEPSILLSKRPAELEIGEENLIRAKRIPIMVSSSKIISANTIIGTVELNPKTLFLTETRQEEGEAMSKIWQTLKSHHSEKHR